MRAVTDHFASHTPHLIGCGVAAMLVAIAIVFNLPIIGILGALLCAAMMIGMIWMMVSMAAKRRE